MDFEEQLEKAERLESPSLVGSSLRSADDSAHQNYIHPEKYTGKKSMPLKQSILNSSIGASLDDLISEGALLGSEEDFDRFLDDKGNVKNDAKYLAKSSVSESSNAAGLAAKGTSPLAHSVQHKEDSPSSAVLSPVDSEVASGQPEFSDTNVGSGAAAGDSLYATDNYSAPNLSEYQLEHQISDHSELLDLVKSYDLSKLPSSSDREIAKSNINYAASERIPKSVKVAASKKNPVFAVEKSDGARIANSDSLHTPYFPRDERSPSRSRAGRLPSADARSRSASRSRSVNKPHLARGDSYKSTHEEAPIKYELPAGLAVEEEVNDNDRRSRQSRPTMGDSIAAAEAQEVRDYHSENITRDPSLVTTGDYTNFNVDTPSERLNDLNLYSVRSQASTNYLRSISRSRSRQPQSRFPKDGSLLNEKNDSNPEELAREGALVSDDPYDQMSGLDAMVDKVLKNPKGFESLSLKKLVNDVPAEEKVTETREQLIAEEAPVLSAEDIKVDKEEAGEASKSSEYVEEIVEAETEEDIEETQDAVDVLAEVKVQEAHEQLVAEEAPLVTAKDIKLDEVKKSEYGKPKKEEPIDDDGAISKHFESKILDSLKALEATKVKALDAKSFEAVERSEVIEPADTTEAVEASETVETSDAVVSPETPKVDESAEDTSFIESKETSKVKSDTEVEESAITKDVTEEVLDSVEDDVSKEKVEKEDSIEDPEVEDADEVLELKPSANEEPSADVLAETADPDIPKAAPFTVEAKSAAASAVDTSDVSAKLESVIDEDTVDATHENDEEVLPLNIKRSSNTDLTEAVEQETDDKKTEVKEIPSKVDTELEPRVEAEAKEPEVTAKEPETAAKDIDYKEAETKPKEPEEPTSTQAAPVEDEDFDVSPEELRKHLQSLPIYLFTSLAGGMQIIQRTNRLATILQGNGIKFEYRDLGTDEDAKKLWRRYAQGKTLPGVVRGDDFIGDWKYIDEVNEDYRLHEVLYETL